MTARSQADRSPLSVERSWRPARSLNVRTLSRVNFPGTAPARTRKARRDLAISINCSLKKVHSGRGRRFECPRISFSASKAPFTIEGYTDSIGTYEYNLDLSQRRAANMKQYLVEALGIDPSHIDARGRGSTKFIVPPRAVAPSSSQAEFDVEIERERS